MGFRRRPNRPVRGSGPRRIPLAAPPVVRQALIRADRARIEGAYDEAARIYKRLADEAYVRGRPRPGIQMDLEAARAWLQEQGFDRAQASVIRALKTAVNGGALPPGVAAMINRVADAMAALGSDDQVVEFRRQVDSTLIEHGLAAGDLSASPPPPRAEVGGQLPAHCPSCYAPVHSDEVEWAEPGRAQCGYCGTVMLVSEP